MKRKTKVIHQSGVRHTKPKLSSVGSNCPKILNNGMKIECEATEMKCEYMHKENHECNFAFTLKWARNTLGLCIFNRNKAWGCVLATAQKLGLFICNKHRAVRVVYLQQKKSLGVFICSKDKAWGCVFATNTRLGVVYLHQTHTLGLCICNNTKLGVVFVQQTQRLGLCICSNQQCRSYMCMLNLLWCYTG